MSLIRQRNLERRLRCVDTQRSARRAASPLSGQSLQLRDAAQELERATGNRDKVIAGGGAVPAIEQMGPVLEAIANASLSLSLLVRELVGPAPRARSRDEMAEPTAGDQAERATRLLFGASQSIRIAAEASKVAAAAVRSASPSSG
jgi:hypothetical protein